MIVKRPCLCCGAEVEFFYAEHVGQLIPGTTLSVEHEDETGWYDAICKACGICYDHDLIALRMKGDPDGFVVGLDSGEEVLNLLSALLRECPEAREKAREILAQES